MDERGAVAIFRVVDILDLLREHPRGLGLSVIAKLLNLPKSTTFRLLNALETRGLVRQDNTTEVYKLGFSVMRLASAFLDGFNITEEARICLERLNKEWDETVHLGVIDESGFNMVYILKFESTKIVRMVSQIGRAVPIHCTALGKAYYSYIPEDVVQAKLEEYEFKRFSPTSITNINDFLKDLELTKTRGYSIDQGENDYNVFCVAAPIIKS